MIFVNELIKAFCKRTTIAIFAVLLLLNGVLLYINETKQTLEYTLSSTKPLIRPSKGLTLTLLLSEFHRKSRSLN